MSVLFVLILISALIAGAFLAGFIWSVRSGQYDDTYSPSIRMLFNDNKPKKGDKAEATEEKTQKNSKNK